MCCSNGTAQLSKYFVKVGQRITLTRGMARSEAHFLSTYLFYNTQPKIIGGFSVEIKTTNNDFGFSFSWKSTKN